jgi:hypothetical protein
MKKIILFENVPVVLIIPPFRFEVFENVAVLALIPPLKFTVYENVAVEQVIPFVNDAFVPVRPHVKIPPKKFIFTSRPFCIESLIGFSLSDVFSTYDKAIIFYI